MERGYKLQNRQILPLGDAAAAKCGKEVEMALVVYLVVAFFILLFGVMSVAGMALKQ